MYDPSNPNMNPAMGLQNFSNQYFATPQQQLDDRMRNNNYWGGSAHGAQDDIDKFRAQGNAWGDPNSHYYQQSNEDANAQSASLALAAKAASGVEPSQAQILMQQGGHAAQVSQGQNALSARGAAGIAQGASAAQGNVAAIGAQNINQVQALRAQEMEQGRAQYAQQAEKMRQQSLIQAGLGQKGQLGYEGMANGVGEAQLNANNNYEQLQQEQFRAQAETDRKSQDRANSTASSVGAAGLGAAGALAGLVFLSDMRKKEDIVPLDEGSLQRRPLPMGTGQGPEMTALDVANQTLVPYAYAYRPGAVPGSVPGQMQAGIMAQDAERHPLTAAMVKETPKGKAIDVGKAASFSLATGAEHSKRLSDLERKMMVDENWRLAEEHRLRDQRKLGDAGMGASMGGGGFAEQAYGDRGGSF